MIHWRAGKLRLKERPSARFPAHRHDAAWLDDFIASLDRRRAVEAFTCATESWRPSQAEAARFKVKARLAASAWAC